MNKNFLFLFLINLFSLSTVCKGQSGIITTIAGDGISGFIGDGGPATAAEFFFTNDVVRDNIGRIFVVDLNAVRVIDQSGIINNYAGNGTTGGLLGDGWPANYAEIDNPSSVATDNIGNLYIADRMHYRLRKVNTSGIISTIAGTGTSGYTGDGGQATSASIFINGVVLDQSGNIYFTDDDHHVIRKINTSGIITTIAGTGIAGFSGDGGSATSAQIGAGGFIKISPTKDITFIDASNYRIRKIDTAGIISTIAGNGTTVFSGDGLPAIMTGMQPQGLAFGMSGDIFLSDASQKIFKINSAGIISTISGDGAASYAGDGGPAINAEYYTPGALTSDEQGHLYVFDNVNHRIRMFPTNPYALSDSISVFIDQHCSETRFSIITKHYSSAYSIKTFFNNNEMLVNSLTMSDSLGYIAFDYSYPYPGTYRMKHVLFNGALPIDSITYSYNNLLCNELAVQFYYDANSNCIQDGGEPNIVLPLSVEVDSNGIPIDTISATSGFYYQAFGLPGDVYSFRLLTSPLGLYASCPTSGIIFDTLQLGINNSLSKKMGLSCPSTSVYDLTTQIRSRAGRHQEISDIFISNNFCTPESGPYTLTFSPKYIFASASTTPTSVMGNTATWNLSGVSAVLSSPVYIHVTLSVPTPDILSTWLTPGDTANSKSIISLIIGDIDTTNNIIIRTDTIKSSYDPNEMSVMPEGFILPGMKLQYAINFENTGNDTAHNIYVIDTLSDNVDPHTISIVSASSAMNIAVFNNGFHNVVKFEFPVINLLDSSHHDKCNGIVIFNVKAKSGLADGSIIFNHAGIFFDDNPVVVTNTVENTVGCITGSGTVCAGSNITLTEAVIGGSWTITNSHATIVGGIVTGVTAGVDTVIYAITNLFGTSATTKIITINPLPDAGTITGPSVVCEASTITLADTALSGVWSSSNSYAAVSSSVVSGISPGIDTISYVVTNSCGSASSNKIVTINPLPTTPAPITGLSTVCEAATVTLGDLITGGVWSSSNSTATVLGGLVTGILDGIDTISYVFTNSCGSASATKIITVNPLPMAGSITGLASVCVGLNITLSDGIAGGTWSATNTNATVLTGVVAGINAGIDTIQYFVTNSCGVAHVNQVMTVNPSPSAITGITHVCESATTTLSDATIGGTWGSVTSSIAAIGSGTGIVTGVLPGSTTIVYSLPAGCSATVTVTVDPWPSAITGITTVCMGDTTALADITTGGIWSNVISGIATVGPTGMVSGILSGTSIITYTLPTGCLTTTNVTVNPLPVAGMITGADTICSGLTITLTESFTGGTWSSSNTLAAVDSTGLVSGLATGVDIIVYTVINDCGTATAVFPILVLPCALDNSLITNITQSIQVYPNPANDELNISGITTTARYRLLNVTGTSIQYGFLVEENNRVSIFKILPGIYILEITGQNGDRNIVRVVKE